MSKKKDLGILAVIGVLVSIPLGVILNGLVACQLWKWFIVDYFQIKPLTIPVAIGLSVLFSAFVYNKNEIDEDMSVSMALCFQFVRPLFLLGFGFVVQLFM